jgi:hypothetical protein
MVSELASWSSESSPELLPESSPELLPVSSPEEMRSTSVTPRVFCSVVNSPKDPLNIFPSHPWVP